MCSSDLEGLPVGQLQGKQYMIPAKEPYQTKGTSLEFNASLVKKYAMDVTTIKSIEDLEPFLEHIKKQEPHVIPLAQAHAITGYTQLLSGYDNLGDTLGVLNLTETNALEVVNWYETTQFMELVSLMHRWFTKGYIAKDTLISQPDSLIGDPPVFCVINTIMPGANYGLDLANESGVIEIQLDYIPQLKNSFNTGLMSMGIASTSERPDKAMQLLDRFYTDATLVNLLMHGIEGEHFNLTEEGLVNRKPLGSSNYFINYGQAINLDLQWPSTVGGIDYAKDCEIFSAKDQLSPAFGFVFDATSVAEEIEACRSIVDAYYPVIECGAVNPVEEIPVFNAKLKEAGIDQIIEAKQRQLDQWYLINKGE